VQRIGIQTGAIADDGDHKLNDRDEQHSRCGDLDGSQSGFVAVEVRVDRAMCVSVSTMLIFCMPVSVMLMGMFMFVVDMVVCVVLMVMFSHRRLLFA
jgi:hypothetical protein